MAKDKRDHLRRLDAKAYQGLAQVHWILTIDQRKQGWLSSTFCLTFRELLTHTLARYHLCCPVFCLMPDHLHLIWIGWNERADQRNAMKHLRQHSNRVLERTGHRMQKQAYDHVLRESEKSRDSLSTLVDYIQANPVRSQLCQDHTQYPYTGCLLPGYPEVDVWDPDFWDRFWRIYSTVVERDWVTPIIHRRGRPKTSPPHPQWNSRESLYTTFIHPIVEAVPRLPLSIPS